VVGAAAVGIGTEIVVVVVVVVVGDDDAGMGESHPLNLKCDDVTKQRQLKEVKVEVDLQKEDAGIDMKI
jgi:hypothetical protein